MDLGLGDQVFVVTGGSRGLGRASAGALTAEGAHVLLSSRSGTAATEAAAGLPGPGTAVAMPADTADPEAADRLVTRAQQHFGRLDGALISVGGPPAGTATDVADEAWRAAFESVFLGALRLARTLAVALAGRPGSIAFVLSSSVRAPIGGLAISNGLRPGLAMVAKDLADELGPVGIRVNGLLPGRIATDRTLSLDGGDEAVRAARSAGIPLRRYGDPAEFGRVAAFLLSPAAGYLTGVMLPVDGGALRAL